MLGFDVFGLEEVFRVARVTVSVTRFLFFLRKSTVLGFQVFPNFPTLLVTYLAKARG